MGNSGVNFVVGCVKPGLGSICLVLYISACMGDGRESKQFSFTPCVDCLSLSLVSVDSFSSSCFFNITEILLTDSCVVTYMYILDFTPRNIFFCDLLSKRVFICLDKCELKYNAHVA